ncbi:MAG: hypothetical protein H6581_03770 [Bacteroidia bacterium]|nr:hypothetical protein [Bacteroidia bacterium]
MSSRVELLEDLPFRAGTEKMAIELALPPLKKDYQPFILQMDALTREYLGKLDPGEGLYFTQILTQREKARLYNRLDTADFAYAFIQESWTEGDSAAVTLERYFDPVGAEPRSFPKGSSDYFIPFQVCQDGKCGNAIGPGYFKNCIAGVFWSGIADYFYTLDTLLATCNGLQPVQELTYDPTQIWEAPPAYYEEEQRKREANPETYRYESPVMYFGREKDRLEAELAEKLGHTWQIVTLIDREAGKVQVSVQRPARQAQVSLRTIYRIFDW